MGRRDNGWVDWVDWADDKIEYRGACTGGGTAGPDLLVSCPASTTGLIQGDGLGVPLACGRWSVP